MQPDIFILGVLCKNIAKIDYKNYLLSPLNVIEGSNKVLICTKDEIIKIAETNYQIVLECIENR